MGKANTIVLASVLVAICAWVGRRSYKSQASRAPEAQSYVSDHAIAVVTEVVDTVPRIDASKRVEHSYNEVPEKAPGMLAGFLLTGDRTILEQAREQFPDHRLVLLQSALLADRPGSRDLALLEELDPENALPNLLRASLFAESGNLAQFREEMEVAMSKSKLDTGYRQRQALIMDHIIAENLRDLDPDVYLGLDNEVVNRFGHAAKAMANNPRLFGDEYESAGYAVALAEKLRAMGGGRQAYNLAAGQLEIEVLSRLDPRDEYVVEGKSIGERIAELERQVPAIRERMDKYLAPLMSSDGDPLLRLKFFARVRSVGEAQALGWLAGEMEKR